MIHGKVAIAETFRQKGLLDQTVMKQTARHLYKHRAIFLVTIVDQPLC